MAKRAKSAVERLRSYGKQRLRTEVLEDRILLAVDVRSSIFPESAEPLHIAPGNMQWELAPNEAETYYRFSVSDDTAFVHANFQTSSHSFSDAAIALYDADGNLVAYADNDAAPSSHAIEELAVQLDTQRTYILGIIVDSQQPATIAATSEISADAFASPITTNLQTGSAELSGQAVWDSLEDAADVNYHKLHIPNGAQQASIMVTPTSIDLVPIISVFKRDSATSPWQLVTSAISDGNLEPISMTLTSPNGRYLFENEYLIAVSPLNGSTGSYQIDVSSDTLAPANMPAPPAATFQTLEVATLGQFRLSASQNIGPGNPLILPVTAPRPGEMQITFASASVSPLISIYNAQGTELKFVRGSSTATSSASPLQFTVPAAAGESFLVRVGTAESISGLAEVNVSMEYSPEDILPTSGSALVQNIALDSPFANRTFRLPVTNADILAIEIAPADGSSPNPIDPTIAVVHQGGQLTFTKSISRNRIRYVVNVADVSSEIDLALTSVTALPAEFNVQLGFVEVPTEQSLYAFDGAELNLDGDVQATMSSSAFGEPTGIAFYNPMSEQPAETSVALHSQPHSILALYEEYGGHFQLLDWSLADSAGQATLSQTLQGGQYAITSISTSFVNDTSSSVQVSGPALTGVGVGMVPSDAPIFPSTIANQYAADPTTGDFSDPNPVQTAWSSELNILDVVLESEHQQHLWRTLLPLNIVDSLGNGLSIELEPSDISGITADVVRASDQQILATLNSINGVKQTAFVPINQVSPGETLLFRIRSLPDQLEDGIYSLRMMVDTENPHPYEVTERHWKFGSRGNLLALDDPYSDVQQGATPNTIRDIGSPTEISLSQLGNGSLENGFIDDGDANNHVHVYQFQVPTFGQMKVWTETLHQNVNTNLRLYKRISTDAGDFLTPLSLANDSENELVEVLPNFDWFPANRSEIDAQSFIHDLTDFGRLPNDTVYAVVKNQEASLGRYRIHVDVMGNTSDIPLIALSPAAAGVATEPWTANDLALADRTIRYAAIQLPDQHDGTLQIVRRSGNGVFGVQVFNNQGQPLAETSNGQFAVPAGPQTVYARIQELVVPANVQSVTFDISTTIILPRDTTPLPNRQPNGNVTPIDGNQFGDGTITDSLAGSRTGKLFSITAAPGPLRINVAPHDNATLRWAVYVDGTLQTWDQTTFDSGEAIADTLWSEIYVPGRSGRLPLFDQKLGPTASASAALQNEAEQSVFWTRDVPFDGAVGTLSTHYQNVVIYVEPVRSAGDFTISVDSGNWLPMRSSELTLDLRNGSVSRLTEPSTFFANANVTGQIIDMDQVTGQQWTRFYLPDHAAAPKLRISAMDVAGLGSTFHYSLFDTSGVLQLSGNGSIPILGGGTYEINLPNGLPNGRAYLVQIQPTTAGVESLRLRASAVLPTDNVPATLNETITNPLFGSLALDPLGDAQITSPGLKTAFWVGAAGEVHVSATSNQIVDSIRIYRIERYVASEVQSIEDLVLVDHSVQSGQFASTTLTLNTELDPGAYALEVVGNGPMEISIDTPTPIVETITLDPNFGISSLPGLTVHDDNRIFGAGGFASVSTSGGKPHNLLPEYRQALFQVTTGTGARGFGMADAVATDVGDAETFQRDDLAFFSWWRNGAAIDQFERTFTLQTSTLNPTRDNNGVLKVNEATVSATSGIGPHETLYLALNRANLNASVDVSASFPVPFSGTPDLVVLPIVLTPNHGETRVGINVTNIGYAPAFANASEYSVKDDSQNNPQLKWVTSTMQTATLGPFGSSLRLLEWDPITTTDEVKFEVDVNNTVNELDEDNNVADEILSSVNQFAPEVVSFELANPDRDGMQGPQTDPQGNIWGRYIVNVAGTDNQMVFQVKDDDDLTLGKDDIYKSYIINPNQITIAFNSDHQHSHPFVPKNLQPTSGENPNEYVLYTKDIWGLESERIIRVANVVARPGWLTSTTNGISTSLTFDKNTNEYLVQFENRLVDYNKTLNQMLSTDVPFIGTKENQFLVSVSTEANVSLDPSQDIFVPIEAQAKLKILGNTVFDVTYDGNTPATDHIALLANLDIDPQTVEATAFFVSFRMEDLPVLDYNSPEIRLFSYGIPGLASLNANLLINVAADLDAGVTVAFDAAALADPLQLTPLGVARPTFVGLDLNPSLTIEGEAELFGFLDIATISGSIGLNLSLDVGLKADGSQPNDIVKFEDFFSNLDVELSGSLTLATEASVLGFEVWDYEWESPPLFSVGDVYTWDEYDQFVGNSTTVAAEFPDPDLMARDENGNPMEFAPPPAVTTPATGSQSLGELKMRSQPQLILDQDAGLFLQLVDVGNGRSNLAYATRNNYEWDDSLVTLSQPEHVSNPVAALFADERNRPALVTYQATALPDLFAPNVTFDEFANAQEIRYRYFDGESWNAEQTLESNGRFDGNPAIAFNSADQGVLAWTHNSNATPLQSPFTNEIHVATWNSQTHSWSASKALTNDPNGSLASDTRPAVFMDESGTATVVWLRNADTTQGTEIWFSQASTGTWSTPAKLETLGIEGQRITQLAINSAGKDQTGQVRLDVIFAAVAYESMPTENSAANETVAVSRLLHRTAATEAFTVPTGVQTIHQGANYSYLKTLQTADGLTAYWQQSDGNVNEIFASSTSVAEGRPGGWSSPVQISQSDALEIAPVLAIDQTARQGDRWQVIYDQRMPLGSSEPVPPPSSTSSDGIPLTGNVSGQRLQALPEFAFSKPFRFAGIDHAAIGSNVLGQATIVNQGLAASPVRIDMVRLEDNITLQSRQATLGPGGQFDWLELISVTPGKQTIALRLTALTDGAAEMISTDNNVSQDILFGLVDLTIDSVVVTSPPVPGQTVPVQVTIRNTSSAAISVPFTIDLFSGASPAIWNHQNALATQTVPSLAANQTATYTLPWKIAADGGYLELAVVVDGTHFIDEASEFNNVYVTNVHMAPDMAVNQLFATLLDYSGEDNVSVTAEINNLGELPAADVVVQLWWSRNDGPFQLIREQSVVEFLPNESVMVPFSAPGWAGVNNYRITLAPASIPLDKDHANDFASEYLQMQGFADLVIDFVATTNQTPTQGEPLDLRVAVRNQGIDDAEDIRIEVMAVSPVFGRRVVGLTTIDQLSPFASQDVLIPIDTSHLVGEVELLVIVDRHEKIMEISDLNNQRSIRVTFAQPHEFQPCDLNQDGECNATDIDYLHEQIRGADYLPELDINLDGTLNETDAELWITDLMDTSPGDTNLDGLFNSTDLVLVFQAGLYEDALPNNASFAQGDWNGDGDFNTTDLVFAFQGGGYRRDAVFRSFIRSVSLVRDWFEDDCLNRYRRIP
ncbi:MAG: hypothetical protein KDA87_08315 [Planctomycetales bacterium]|nr:hypothetical protein [Planctomycetales bacterium]